jgi:hypothetical protein
MSLKNWAEISGTASMKKTEKLRIGEPVRQITAANLLFSAPV